MSTTFIKLNEKKSALISLFAFSYTTEFGVFVR